MLRYLLDEGSWRCDAEGEAVGEVDMRSLSGSSEAFLLRLDMLCVLCVSVRERLSALLLHRLIHITISSYNMHVPDREGDRRFMSRCGADSGSLWMTLFMIACARCVQRCE